MMKRVTKYDAEYAYSELACMKTHESSIEQMQSSSHVKRDWSRAEGHSKKLLYLHI